MPHHSLEDRQPDTTSRHVGAEGVAEPMGIGVRESWPLASRTKHPSQRCTGHRTAAAFALEHDEDAIRAAIAERAQILRKIERLEYGLHGNIKRLHEAEAMYRLRMGDYRILFDVKGGVIVIRRIGNRKDVYD